jgi:hypothetical protein
VYVLLPITRQCIPRRGPEELTNELARPFRGYLYTLILHVESTQSEIINGGRREHYQLTCDYSSSFQLFSFTNFSRSSRYFPCEEFYHLLN